MWDSQLYFFCDLILLVAKWVICNFNISSGGTVLYFWGSNVTFGDRTLLLGIERSFWGDRNLLLGIERHFWGWNVTSGDGTLLLGIERYFWGPKLVFQMVILKLPIRVRTIIQYIVYDKYE